MPLKAASKNADNFSITFRNVRPSSLCADSAWRSGLSAVGAAEVSRSLQGVTK